MTTNYLQMKQNTFQITKVPKYSKNGQRENTYKVQRNKNFLYPKLITLSFYYDRYGITICSCLDIQ